MVLRVHARIADLLTMEKMRYLAEGKGVEGFLVRLEETPYGTIELEEGVRVPIALERVFYEKFIERIEKIVELTPRKIGEFLRSYYSIRFEVINLKRILRGKFSEASDEEILESLIPMEPFSVESYEELVETESVEEAVDMLKGTSYSRLIERLDMFRKYEVLWPLELLLNYIYASTTLESVQKLASSNRRVVHSIVEFETDIENVLIAVKQRERGEEFEDYEPEELFPVTYGIGLDKLKEIIEAPKLPPVIQSLGSSYTEVLAPIYEGDVALIRTKLRLSNYRHAAEAKRRDQYGFNAIMAYLVYSEIEKDNLVGIAWGKAQGLRSEQLLKYIVIPRSD